MFGPQILLKDRKKFITQGDKLLLGWKEWCQLPQLGIPAIKAKIDTGARTSALHAFDICPIFKDNQYFVKFSLYPIQANYIIKCNCEALIIDQRSIKSSNGQIEERYIINTEIKLGCQQWKIQMSLSNRDPLKFRMLLGREALNKHALIDPSSSLFQGQIKRADLYRLYQLSS